MKVAVATVFLKVTARGDDLGIEQSSIDLALDLAEVGGLPVPQQCFEELIVFGAANVHLDVAAAGRTAGMVGRAAGCSGAGIGIGRDRERMAARGGRWEMAVHHFSPLNDPEVVIPEATRLGGADRYGGMAREAVCPADAHSGAAILEVAARDVDGHLAPELVVILESFPEVESLSMTEEPGGVVVFLALECGHPGHDIQTPALSAEGATGGWGHRDPGRGSGVSD